ncbi:MAG: uroporphyrinogen decarboxylase family protein [Armatimonadota bacterium]
MTPRERVLAVLAGDKPERVPFLIWNNKIPPELEARLLELGACVIVKSTVWREQWHGVEITREPLPPQADGHPRTRTVFRTPAGDLSIMQAYRPGTIWLEKHLFDSPADYDALEAFLQARSYVPDFNTFRQHDAQYLGQCLARPATVHAPMHEVIYDLLGIENFCMEWVDNRERVLRLIELMTIDVDARVQLMADSPTHLCVIDGNTEVSIMGIDRYREYYLPHIHRSCERLHAVGKYAGAHLDGNNLLLADEVAQTSLDFIESFTPPPDCNLPLTEARHKWPEKTLLVNFPSSLHHGGPDAVRHDARELLREGVGDGRHFVMGVIEDVPNYGIDTLVPLAEETAAWRLL